MKQAVDEYYNILSKKISNYVEKDGREFLCQTMSQLMANARVLLQEAKVTATNVLRSTKFFDYILGARGS